MSRKGNVLGNAVVEGFFSSLKLELVYTTDFATHEQARLAAFEYIEVFYNRQRRHSSLGYMSSATFLGRAAAQALRVTVVGDRVMAAAIDSQALPRAREDWRREGVALIDA